LDLSGEPDLQALVKHSVVKEVGGQKIGFIGVITPSLKEVAPKLGGVKVISPGAHWMDPVVAEVENLKKQGVNKIFLVSHSGVDMERLLGGIPDVDVVVGGHSHTRLDDAIIIDHPDGSKAMVVQTGCYGRALGRMDLTFDKDGKLIMPESKYRLIDIGERIFEEPDVKAYVTEKGKPFAALSTTILAQAEANFDNRFKMYPTDSPIGDLIADALFDAGINQGVTITLQNRGGMRGGLDQGPISLEKVREILPFQNKLMIATVTGKSLLAALENSIKAVAGGATGGRFLDVHGLKFAWDPTLELGHRILYAYAQGKEGNYEPINPDELYRIGMNDYSFNGGEEYDFKDAKDVVDTGLRLSTIFEDYLKKVKKVTPVPPDRFLRVSSNIAKKRSDAKGDVIDIDYPSPGAELTVIAGDDKGVSFLKQHGVVPLSNPYVLRNTKTDDGGRLTIPIDDLTAKIKDKNSAALWVSMILKARDKDGTTTRIVSVPIQLR
jgi:5'-nucleotidase